MTLSNKVPGTISQFGKLVQPTSTLLLLKFFNHILIPVFHKFLVPKFSFITLGFRGAKHLTAFISLQYCKLLFCSPFPTVAESIQKELDEYRASEEEVKRLKHVMVGNVVMFSIFTINV